MSVKGNLQHLMRNHHHQEPVSCFFCLVVWVFLCFCGWLISFETNKTGASGSVNEKETGLSGEMFSSSMEVVLSMGFSYMQVIEAYTIFGDDVDSMVCYLLETSSSIRRKGKATE